MTSDKEMSNDTPNRSKRGSMKFLKRKKLLGIGAIATIAAAVIAILTFAQGSDNSPEQAARANNNNCIFQAGNNDTCIQSSAAPSSQSATLAPSRLSDCEALTADAGAESSQLSTLQDTISIDAPESRVTGSLPGYKSAYQRATSLMQLVITEKDRFESEGGVINVDPQLEGDLRNMPGDLTNLDGAVHDKGIGGDEWNQLYNYSDDFSSLAKLRCIA